jgi:hypothetical protein
MTRTITAYPSNCQSCQKTRIFMGQYSDIFDLMCISYRAPTIAVLRENQSYEPYEPIRNPPESRAEFEKDEVRRGNWFGC